MALTIKAVEPKCEFLDTRKRCYLCKQICLVPRGEVQACKYVLRQNPVDPATRFKKVADCLADVASKRGVPSLALKEDDIDLSQSVYANVKRLSSRLEVHQFVLKERKALSPDEILSSRGVMEQFLTQGVTERQVTLHDHNEAKKTLVLDYGGQKVLCKLRIAPSKFLDEMKRRRKPEKFFWQSIEEMREI